MKTRKKNVCIDMRRNHFPLEWLYEEYSIHMSKEIDKLDRKIKKDQKTGKSKDKDHEKRDNLEQKRTNAQEFMSCFVENGQDCNNDSK